jgi:hypothetical protein
MNDFLKDYCWNLRLDHVFDEKLSPFVLPSIRQSIEFLGLSFRFEKKLFSDKYLEVASLNFLHYKKIKKLPKIS